MIQQIIEFFKSLFSKASEDSKESVPMKINDEGKKLIKDSEGLRLKAYLDAVGVPTIGYGETGPNIHMGMEWTEAQAEASFDKRVEEFADRLRKIIFVTLNDNQFSAIVSLAYNVGIGNVKKSTLLALVNMNDFKGAAEEFSKWIRAGGKVLPGLVKRRAAERELFLK